MKMLVLTKNHPRSNPYLFGLMECDIDGGRIDLGDFKAKEKTFSEVFDHVPSDFIEVENPYVEMALLDYAQNLYIAAKDFPR